MNRRRTLRVSILASLLPASVLAQTAAPGCGGVFPAVSDASVASLAPTEVFGGDPSLRIARSPSAEWRSFLGFNLSGSIPPGTTVHEAFLEMDLQVVSGIEPFTFEVRPATSPWYESSLTWSSQPPLGESIGSSSTLAVSGPIRIDVTTLVTAWLAGVQPDLGLALLPGSGDMDATFASREGGGTASSGPRLVVACAPAESDPPVDEAVKDAAQKADIDRLRSASLRPVQMQVDLQVERGALRWADFELPLPATAGSDGLSRALWFLGEYRGLFRLDDPGSELQLVRRSPSGNDLFFHQRHAGIPVEGAEVAIHLGEATTSTGSSFPVVSGASGLYLSDVTIGSQPRLPADRAVALARLQAGAGAVLAGDPQLRYVNPALTGGSDTTTHLAWAVNVSGGSGDARYLVDAGTGAPISRTPLVESDYHLDLSTGREADSQGGLPGDCWRVSNADVRWFTEAGRFANATPDQEGFDAFQHMGRIYDYWRNELGLDSNNGNGGGIGVYLHVAFGGVHRCQNAQYLDLCNIHEFCYEMGTQDVMGHEFTHGVVRFWSNLAYQGESGALNESYADLFGFFVDSGNWTIGEGSDLGVLRDLSNPPAKGDPDHVLANLSGDMCGERQCNGAGACPQAGCPDFGYVHTNSGIPNKAGYLVIHGGTNNGYVIPGLGRLKAERLFYIDIVSRLRSNSQFIDARNETVAEARLLYGPAEECQVRNAYASVGVGRGDLDCNGEDNPDGDVDGDGVPDVKDNCPNSPNGGQGNIDKDGLGDICDPDMDGDGFANNLDDCPTAYNPGQADFNADGRGDACQDWDGDGVIDAVDNCPGAPNHDQRDGDRDLIGDVCDLDRDGDHVGNASDNCPDLSNPGQADDDNDGVGNVCDLCPGNGDGDNRDPDHDGLANPCDPDDDGDRVDDQVDDCPSVYNPQQEDWNNNGVGAACDVSELYSAYELTDFFKIARQVQWAPGRAIVIPVPVCPGCQGPYLPQDFRGIVDVQMNTGFHASIVDGGGFSVGRSEDEAPAQSIRFNVAPYGISRFGFGTGPGGLARAAAFPGADSVAPDQVRYELRIFPTDGADLGQSYSLSVTFHQCLDADGDGFGLPGDVSCPGGPQSDCDDANPARHPGNAEICDAVDNDCDGVVDAFPTACGVGGCASTGFCSSGFDSCVQGAAAPETCDAVDNDCDGVVDDLPAPTALVAPRPDSDSGRMSLAWDAVPGSTGYDVVRGDLGALRTGATFTAGVTGCAEKNQPANAFVDSVVVPPGRALWYAVRPVACGTPGSFGPGGRGRLDGEVASSPSGCETCPHDKCVPGGPLDPSCHPCAASVCQVDPGCCVGAWDAACVAEVASVCGNLGCSVPASCTHGLCEPGALLTPGCDRPSGGTGAGCVDAICAEDPHCCGVQWDSRCVSEVESVCGARCD